MDLKAFLPTTKKELELRGWDYVDVIIFSADAYIDHPSFGAALIGRLIESFGWRVAIVPQPDWRSDHRDFTKLGRPRKFFAVSGGAMDSMVNHYTAACRLRSDDAYTPDGRAGQRPDRAVSVYCSILRSLYADVPIIIGGIEPSLRRLSHYDYWDNKYFPSILYTTKADLLVYGMGEEPITEIVKAFNNGGTIEDCKSIKQVAYLANEKPQRQDAILLPSYQNCLKDKKVAALTFKIMESESNKLHQKQLIQPTYDSYIVVNEPFEPMTQELLDSVYELPFMRMPHPKYKGKRIPAFDMIRFSVNTHRGCWGGCSFCTISMHQGKFVVSRSEQSIMKEIEKIAQDPDFKGYLSDLGGPSANMYKMSGKDKSLCAKCSRPSCAFPKVCPNMDTNHAPLLALYKRVNALPYIKKAFIGSGVRYDLILHSTGDEQVDKINQEYAKELILNHVSGRLKVAPEHTSSAVLKMMRKPPFELFYKFKELFDRINRQAGLNQQLIPYFISSHPGCRLEDMADLAIKTKQLNFHLEQVQDFTPTPMTYATEMYYSGIDPYSGENVEVAHTPEKKQQQRSFFFWYQPAQADFIRRTLANIGRKDLADKLLPRKKSSTKKSFNPNFK